MPRAVAAKNCMAAEESIDARIRSLPVAARREAIDFIEFLAQKYQKKKSSVISEKQYWQLAAEKSVQKIWDNEDDDVYNELLKG